MPASREDGVAGLWQRYDRLCELVVVLAPVKAIAIDAFKHQIGR